MFQRIAVVSAYMDCIICFVSVVVKIFLKDNPQGFEFFFTVQFIYGVTSSFYFPAVAKMLSLCWFDSRELAVANGAITSSAPMGQRCANLFTVQISNAIGGWSVHFIEKRSVSNIASMLSYTLVPVILLKLNLMKYYRKIGIVALFVVPTLLFFGYSSYNVTVFQIILLFTGLSFGPSLPQAKLGMLELPEVSGPRAGTAMGVFLTAERFGTTLFITALGTIMGAKPSATVMAYFTQLMFVTPLLLILAGYLTKRANAKRAAAQKNNS